LFCKFVPRIAGDELKMYQSMNTRYVLDTHIIKFNLLIF
jgi:hypothetical protein